MGINLFNKQTIAKVVAVLPGMKHFFDSLEDEPPVIKDGVAITQTSITHPGQIIGLEPVRSLKPHEKFTMGLRFVQAQYDQAEREGNTHEMAAASAAIGILREAIKFQTTRKTEGENNGFEWKEQVSMPPAVVSNNNRKAEIKARIKAMKAKPSNFGAVDKLAIELSEGQAQAA